MEEAPEWIMRVLGIGSQNLDRGRFVPPLSYCSVARSDMTDGASPPFFTSMVSGEEEDSSPATEEFPVVRRPYGQGQVILVAMELNDLLRRGTGESQQQILADLLGLRLQRESKDGRSGGWMEVDLFDYLRQRTAFSVTAGLYLGFAFLFVVVYVTVATGGSWAWLKRKKILHHAWLAFAIVALFASGISVLAFQWSRGISYGLQEISVVDGRTASNEVVCRSYFGLKTPTHVQLDLLVPQDARQLDAVNDSPASLRPMSPSPQDSSGYEAFERYSALATVGELHRVPIRATLKQLESQWRGELPGRFFASLKWLRGGTNQLSEESWVENQLGTDLFDCYLFVTRQDVRVNRPYRDLFIRVYPLGILPAGKRVVNFEERLQSMVQSGAAGGEGKVILATRFEECCVGWLRQLGIRMDQPRYQQAEVQRVTVGQQEFVNAMLLMTLFSEIDRDRFQGTGCTVKSSEGEVLDRSLDLRGDNALFVGFSRERGPSRLCYRQAGATGRSWKILDPGKADVVYRMTVPIGEP